MDARKTDCITGAGAEKTTTDFKLLDATSALSS